MFNNVTGLSYFAQTEAQTHSSTRQGSTSVILLKMTHGIMLYAPYVRLHIFS